MCFAQAMNQYWYSKLTTANTCLRKFQRQFVKPDGSHYSYAEQIREPGPLSADMEFGTAIHKGIEGYLAGRNGLDDFRDYLSFHDQSTLNYTRYKHEELIAMGEQFLPRFERLHLKNFTEQQTLPQRLISPPFEGEADYVGLYKGKRSVIDFKTSGRQYDSMKIRTDDQLIIYAHLVKQLINYDIEQVGYLVFVKSTISIQSQTMDLTPAILDSRMSDINKYCETLNQLKYFPKNSLGCSAYGRECGFVDQCFPKTEEPKNAEL